MLCAQIQQWGLNRQEHEGQQVLQRFSGNVADIQATDRVNIMQQPSVLALADLMCTQSGCFNVRSFWQQVSTGVHIHVGSCIPSLIVVLL